jgi:hypothetical protein
MRSFVCIAQCSSASSSNQCLNLYGDGSFCCYGWMSDVMTQLPSSPRVSIGTSSFQGNQNPGQPQRLFSAGCVIQRRLLHCFCNVLDSYPGILGLCMYSGAKNQAPADTVTTLSSNLVIANKFFLSLCRTTLMNFRNPMATGPGGTLVLGAGEDLTCSNCQLTTSNYSFIKYRDTTSDCSYSFYSITIVDFAVSGSSLNLSRVFAPSNSFPFTYLGHTFSGGFSSGCPENNRYPNILDSGTSNILLPSEALKAINRAVCNAYTGTENCNEFITGDTYFKKLDGLPDVNILLWDAASSSIVTLLLPPTA